MNQTFEKISLVVDERENLEDLSAKKLAILSDTSPATISRFAKSKGFNNFFGYKLNLMHGRKSALIKEKSIFDSWFKNIDQSFNEVEKDMQEIIYLLRCKNIYTWSKREYDFFSTTTRSNLSSRRLRSFGNWWISQHWSFGPA